MRFCTSLCSYPHGGWVTLGFLVACMGAVATTCYAVASCHFVIVEFASDSGGFGELFDDLNSRTGELEEYKVGAGLFVWLKPKDKNVKWDDGQCVGYTERQRDVLSDGLFEASRFMGVFVVLFGFVVLIWAFGLACIRMQKWQHWLLQTMLLLLTILTCLVFLVKRSALCNDVQQDTSCSLDAGGLVNIAGALLWFVAFLISVVFMKVPRRKRKSRESSSQDKQQPLAEKQEATSRQDREARDDEEQPTAVAAMSSPVASRVAAEPSTPDTVEEDQSLSMIEIGDETLDGEEEEKVEEPGTVELYIGKFLDKIESLVDG